MNIIRTLLFGFTFASFLNFSLAESANYYKLPAVPDFIQERLGPFGPQEKSYPVPAEHAIFAATDGLEANDGSSLETPTTIEKAFKIATTDSFIILRGGVYRTGDLHFDKKLTIQPYLNETPVLKGSKVADKWVKTGEFWKTKWATTFKAKLPKWHKPEQMGGKHLWYNDWLFIDGTFLIPVGSTDDLEPGKFYVDYDNHEIYIAEDPAGKLVEITAHDEGLVRTHEDGADKEGPTIQGLTLLHYASSAISIESPTVEQIFMSSKGMDPTFSGTKVYDPYIERGEMPDAPIGTRIINNRILFARKKAISITSPRAYIAYNDVSMCGHGGVLTARCHDGVFEHNVMHNNNALHYAGYPGGLKNLYQTSNFVVRNNYFSDQDCVALWFDIGHHECVVVNNYFNNCRDGVKIEISHRTYIAGNVCEKSTIWVANTADVMIYNNTLINSRISMLRNNRGSKPSSIFSFDHNKAGPGYLGYDGHHIVNNVFAGTPVHQRKNAYLYIEDRSIYIKNFQTELNSNNLFISAAGNLAQSAFPARELQVKQYKTLDDFSLDYGEFVTNCVQLDIEPDQLFVSPANGDYRLKDNKQYPAGHPVPDFIAKMLNWKPGIRGLGAFAQEPTTKLAD